MLGAIRHEGQEIMNQAWEIEDNINIMEEKTKENHLIRLQGGCAVDPGLIFVNILTAFEKKMGGYCYNISQAVAGLK